MTMVLVYKDLRFGIPSLLLWDERKIEIKIDRERACQAVEDKI